MLRTRALLAILLPALALPAAAQAVEQLTTPRAMGMADALRSAATGAAGVHLNPSGLALIKNYVAEVAYQFRGSDSIKYIDVSLADSVTSRVAAALFFNYLNADPDRTGYQAGVALALPLGEQFSLGLTPKYQSVGREQQPGGPPTGGKADGFNLDAGATIRLLSFLNVGLVGRNLVDQSSIEAPRTFAVGTSVTLLSMLIVGFDTVFDFDTARLLGRPDATEQRYHMGGELTLFDSVALRAGYIRDTARAADFVTYGASFVSPQFALDFGGRKQLDGDTVLGISLRLFLQ